GRFVAAFQDRRQVGDARAAVADLDEQQRGRSLGDGTADGAPSSTTEGGAGKLRDGSGNARLALRVEAEEAGNLARALAGQDDVRLAAHLDGEQGGRVELAQVERH